MTQSPIPTLPIEEFNFLTCLGIVSFRPFVSSINYSRTTYLLRLYVLRSYSVRDPRFLSLPRRWKKNHRTTPLTNDRGRVRVPHR